MTDPELIAALKAALREAILSTSRTVQYNYEFDPAGSAWDVDWSPRVKSWAALCDLDLTKHDPSYYGGLR